MAHGIDDDRLSAYLDGGLAEDEMCVVEDALLKDPEAAGQLVALRAADDRFREWAEEQMPEPPEALINGIQNAFRVRRARADGDGWRRWLVPAAAALAVVVAGAAAFDWMIERRVAGALDQMRAERASDMALLASAVQDVLEHRESGSEASFTNASTGFGVTIVPLRTWQSASGHWCRAFLEVRPGSERETAPVGTACRTSDGVWVRTSTELRTDRPPIEVLRDGRTDL